MLYPVSHIIRKATTHNDINVLYCPTDGLLEQYLGLLSHINFYIPADLYKLYWNTKYRLPVNFKIITDSSFVVYDTILFTHKNQYDDYVFKFKYLHIPIYFYDIFYSDKTFDNTKIIKLHNGDINMMYPFKCVGEQAPKEYDVCIIGDFVKEDMEWVNDILKDKNAVSLKTSDSLSDKISVISKSKYYLDLAVDLYIKPYILHCLHYNTRIITTSQNTYDALKQHNINSSLLVKKDGLEEAMNLETSEQPSINNIEEWSSLFNDIKEEVFIK